MLAIYYLCIVIELQRHIEILLLDNDCVIVPDFGGFVAHNVAARYEADDYMFLPPTRTLGFNPQLRINDSLLVQSYINALDISYPEALRRIEREVDEMKQELNEKGYYTLEDIGTLSINSDGNIQFEPCEAGILSPDFYGLSACKFPTLKDIREAKLTSIETTETVKETVKSEQTADSALLEFIDNEEQNEDRAIEIKMSWIRNAVAIAAAVIAFFLMTTPIANSDLDTRSMSNLQSNLLTKLMPKDTNMAPAKPVVKPTSACASAKEEAKQEAAPATEPIYCIVLASHVKLSNAENYVEQLKKRGIKDAEVYIHRNTVRVVCGSYKTEGEAYRHLNKLNNDEEFAEAWVYKKVSA